MADQDRQRALSQLQNAEESRGVPPAVQELQVSSEPPKAEERSSVEAPQPESAASEAPGAAAAAGEAAAPSGRGAPSSQGDEAAAAAGEG